VLASILGKRCAAVDRALVMRANTALRAGPPELLALIRLLAERLAGVEVGLMGALLVMGRRRSVGRMLLAVTWVYAASEALGKLWPRERPFAQISTVEALVGHAAGRSFPSRHVASALAMAAVGGRAQPALGRTMAAAAILLGASRVAAGLHYPSDVVAGALLGAAIGRMLRG
jgi:membrane-associated phospholipid phosphatase